MFKLADAGDLEKAGASIGNFFYKQMQELEEGQQFYKTVARQLEALQETFAARASCLDVQIRSMKAAAADWGVREE
jgi:hypothetical protein